MVRISRALPLLALFLGIFRPSPLAAHCVGPRIDTTHAGAQAKPDTAAEYEAEINQAVDEHERGNFEEAREHFRKAHAVFPNARTLRGLGKVEFELRNYQQAAGYLEAALGSQERPLTPELRSEVEQLLERARTYVGVVHIETTPETTVISLDGVAVANGPKADLTLGVGEHLLEFQAAGRLAQRRQVRVNGREEIALSVTLITPEVPSDALRPLSSERKSDAQPVYRKWWVWTVAGVAVAGVVTAIALSARDREVRTRMPATSDWPVPNP